MDTEQSSYLSHFNSNIVRISIVGVLVVLSLFLLAETITVAMNFGRSGVSATDTIVVQGSGKATMRPDVARITYTVQNTASTVAEAQAATSKQANAVKEYIKNQGINDKDIRTLSYNVSPQYSYPTPCTGRDCPTYSRNPKITGYQVSQTDQITVRKLDSVGTLLEGLGAREVQNVNGPDFALDDPTAGYDAARADAIAKAKEQAELLAKQLGVHLGKIVNFSESSGGYRYPEYATGSGAVIMEAKTAAIPDVSVGENSYTSSVSITYEIR